MVCARALSFLDGKICAIQEPSIISIIIIVIMLYSLSYFIHSWQEFANTALPGPAHEWDVSEIRY